MKLKDTLTAWNPETAEVKVGSLIGDGDHDWTRPYLMTGGAAYTNVRKLDGIKAGHFVMSEFIGVVVRDGVDPQAAHREYLKIEEYRGAIPPDMEGRS